jgi:hypothetical protein
MFPKSVKNSATGSNCKSVWGDVHGGSGISEGKRMSGLNPPQDPFAVFESDGTVIKSYSA